MGQDMAHDHTVLVLQGGGDDRLKSASATA
jgi:hypothetical protein